MKNILTILFIFHHVITFAQTFTLQCDTIKISYSNAYLENSDLAYNCSTIQIDTGQISKRFLEMNRNYLMCRVGPDFYSKLQFEEARFIGANQFELPCINKKNTKKLTYLFRYSFIVQDSMKYYFSIAFNRKGKRISNHYLPLLKQNNYFDKRLDACQSIAIANLDSMCKGKAYAIDFEYSSSSNCFMWVVYKPTIKIDEENIFLRKILIHANSGKIIGREQVKAKRIKCSQL